MKSVYRLIAVSAALLLIVPAASADWSDNFDSYALGGIIGQGGWDGWEGAAAADAFVTDAQAYSSPNSLAAIPTTDLVQDFDEDAGEWEMTAWCYIPSGSTGEQYFIMLNSYWPDTNNWSVQILFDSDADLVENTMFGSTATAAIIYDTWTEIKIEINLATNSQSTYYDGTFMDSTVWQTSGVNEISALDLFSNGGSTIFWDDCQLINTGGALEQSTWGHIKTIM